jgi:hypothetical protein
MNKGMKMRKGLLVFLAGFGFGACILNTQSDRVAGAEDFPNTLEPLGKVAASQVNVQAEWNEFDQVPTQVGGLAELDSTLQSEAVSEALGKGAARAADVVVWDFSDTARGKVRRLFVHTGLGVQRDEDTMVFVYDEAFRQRKSDSVTLLARKGRSQRINSLKQWRMVNEDSAGPLDKGWFASRNVNLTTQGFREYQVTVHLDSALPRWSDTTLRLDSLLAMRGLALGEYLFVRGKASDTLEVVRVQDNDGDGRLARNGSGKVVLTRSVWDPPFRPSVVRSLQRVKGLYVSESGRILPQFYSDLREERDGKTIVFRVRGSGSDSLYAPGDTVTVDKTVSFPEPKDLAQRSDAYTVWVSDDSLAPAGNRLLKYVAAWKWRLGEIEESRLVFKSHAPVDGSTLRGDGTLSMDVSFRDGTHVSVDGDLSGTRIQGKVLNESGGKSRRFRVTWDVLGNLIDKAPEL